MAIVEDSIVTESGLRFYYKNFCPVKDLIRWISYEDSTILNKREISFTYQKGGMNDVSEIYVRWQSFDGSDKFYKTLCEFDTVPFKFDIGAIYSKKIALMHLTTDFRPVQRELVFDIDMDDYDNYRTCCTEKKVCIKCWRFIKIAVELITRTLQVDFGFKNILWVYSGRRGIHCWVCDNKARSLPAEGRISIIDYLNLISEGHKKKVNVYGIESHPLIARAFEVCYSNFKDLLLEQNLFKNKQHVNSLLDYIPEKYTAPRKVVMNAGRVSSSLDLFNSLCDSLNVTRPGEYMTKMKTNMSGTSNSSMGGIGMANRGMRSSFPSFFMDIVIAFSYPRLDVNVTKDIGHLLKAPFCVHAKTGRICVPVDHENIDRFNPQSVPTIESLQNFFDRGGDPQNSPISQYVVYFREKFLSRCIVSAKTGMNLRGETINLGKHNGVDF